MYVRRILRHFSTFYSPITTLSPLRRYSTDFDLPSYFIGVSSSFRRVRVLSSSTQFESHIPSRRAGQRKLPDSSCFFYSLLTQNDSLAASAPPRISPQRLMPAGAIRNSFQDVKDQVSLSGFDFGNPGELARKWMRRKW